MTQGVIDGRRARGDESRRAALAHAMDLASVEGLDGLSIARIADAAGQSKSGVAALFGSKERLQLAAIDAAQALFTDEVIAPARAATERGLERVVALVDGWIAYSERRVFSGGCFFSAASVEFDSKPGAVRDRVMAALDAWEGYLTVSIGYAMERGELPGLTDAGQLAFEITALLDAANTRSLLRETDVPYRRAAVAVADRLVALGAAPATVAPLRR
ncbi:TetR family transcriptional regulator [Agromyces rhizosphaerae]|uniref:TetR family transcriptional regulator n=1 Tax=Agromyces rhizosphaerae TaxID=88374 RepID=A0A9W6CR67_9MICO|nr:TetR/AcrR family transcriptional regulator [Agromyces rhizosphaerae]GLI27371.1 TetR family transcriptional regulator [Agromyces rhizosphaerae]